MLGLPHAGSQLNVVQSSSRPRDKLNDQAINYSNQGERIARHNHLCGALYNTAVTAAVGPVKEGRFRCPVDVLIYLPSGAIFCQLLCLVMLVVQVKIYRRYLAPECQRPVHLDTDTKRKIVESICVEGG